jgi:hypothetical protein
LPAHRVDEDWRPRSHIEGGRHSEGGKLLKIRVFMKMYVSVNQSGEKKAPGTIDFGFAAGRR